MDENCLKFDYSVDLKQDEELLHYNVYSGRVDNLILYHFIMIEDKACALPEMLFFMKEADECEALEHAQNMLNNQYNIEKVMKEREDIIQELKPEIMKAEKHRKIIDEEWKVNENYFKYDYRIELNYGNDKLEYRVFSCIVGNLTLYRYIIVEYDERGLVEILVLANIGKKNEANKYAQKLLDKQYQLEQQEKEIKALKQELAISQQAFYDLFG